MNYDFEDSTLKDICNTLEKVEIKANDNFIQKIIQKFPILNKLYGKGDNK